MECPQSLVIIVHVCKTNATTKVFAMIPSSSKGCSVLVPTTNVSLTVVIFSLVMPKFECSPGLITLNVLSLLVPTSFVPTSFQNAITENCTHSVYTYPRLLEHCLYLTTICNCPCLTAGDRTEILAVIFNAYLYAYHIVNFCVCQFIYSWCNLVLRFATYILNHCVSQFMYSYCHNP